jgi:hypothetical protein
MNTKKQISTIFLIVVFLQFTSAQQKPDNQLTPDEINKATLKLIEYYESYEDGSTESQRRAKHDNAIEELTSGAASTKDKNDAYKVIDAYIKADKSPSPQTGNKQGSLDDAIKQTDDYKKAEAAINVSINNLQNMSYPEFEQTVLQLKPGTGRREIKETYNKMHGKDGKQVAITAADDEITPQQQIFWAIETIENPRNYEEFIKAAKILDPEISETKLKQGWEKYKAK